MKSAAREPDTVEAILARFTARIEGTAKMRIPLSPEEREDFLRLAFLVEQGFLRAGHSRPLRPWRA